MPNKSRLLPVIDEGYFFHDTPQNALQRAILARAIYDLTPEADFKDRRSAIKWFSEDEKVDRQDEHPFSFRRIKEDLDLGAMSLSLIQRTLEEAISFQSYASKCRSTNTLIDVEQWVSTRVHYRKLNQKPGIPSVRFRKRKQPCDLSV